MELRENLTDLDVVMDNLGPHWDALMTSPIFDHGGNRERATYVYNKKKVRHHRLASNAQEPRTKLGGDYLAAIEWWGAPFLVSFRAGDAELLLLTAHVRWGASASERVGELTLLANWVAEELVKDPYAGKRDVVVLGDFTSRARRARCSPRCRRGGWSSRRRSSVSRGRTSSGINTMIRYCRTGERERLHRKGGGDGLFRRAGGDPGAVPGADGGG